MAVFWILFSTFIMSNAHWTLGPVGYLSKNSTESIALCEALTWSETSGLSWMLPGFVSPWGEGSSGRTE